MLELLHEACATRTLLVRDGTMALQPTDREKGTEPSTFGARAIRSIPRRRRMISLDEVREGPEGAPGRGVVG